MPTLDWIGKSKVVNHHLDVPYKTLKRQYSFDKDGTHQEDNGSENMIIHGDNLEALKSLLPQYEGRIKCIYIEMKPPKLIQFNYSSAAMPGGVQSRQEGTFRRSGSSRLFSFYGGSSMKQITNKEYEEWLKYKDEKNKGRVLLPDTIRFICEAYDYDPVKIGRHFLELLPQICPEN